MEFLVKITGGDGDGAKFEKVVKALKHSLDGGAYTEVVVTDQNNKLCGVGFDGDGDARISISEICLTCRRPITKT